MPLITRVATTAFPKSAARSGLFGLLMEASPSSYPTRRTPPRVVPPDSIPSYRAAEYTTDFLSDARLKGFTYGALKKALQTLGASSEDLFGMSTRFALLNYAEARGISIDHLLDPSTAGAPLAKAMPPAAAPAAAVLAAAPVPANSSRSSKSGKSSKSSAPSAARAAPTREKTEAVLKRAAAEREAKRAAQEEEERRAAEAAAAEAERKACSKALAALIAPTDLLVIERVPLREAIARAKAAGAATAKAEEKLQAAEDAALQRAAAERDARELAETGKAKARAGQMQAERAAAEAVQERKAEAERVRRMSITKVRGKAEMELKSAKAQLAADTATLEKAQGEKVAAASALGTGARTAEAMQRATDARKRVEGLQARVRKGEERVQNAEEQYTAAYRKSVFATTTDGQVVVGAPADSGAQDLHALMRLRSSDKLVQVLAQKHIALIDAGWLRQRPAGEIVRRRQALEADDLRRHALDLTAEEHSALGGESPFVSADSAVAMLSSGKRCVAVLSYAWATRDSPDPTGERLATLVEFLNSPEGKHIKAVFWDFISLFQWPRTDEQEEAFLQSLSVMGSLYASPIGTTVVRHTAIPPRPPDFDGQITLTVPDGEEEAMRQHLAAFGAVSACALNGTPAHDDEVGRSLASWSATFSSHADAEACVAAPLPTPLRAGRKTSCQLVYNARLYRDRGWPHFETAVSTEFLARSAYFDKSAPARKLINGLPPKLVDIGPLEGDAAFTPMKPRTVVLEPDDRGIGVRLADVIEQFKHKAFTGAGDAEKVIGLYKTFVNDIESTIHATGATAGFDYMGEKNAGGEAHGYGQIVTAEGDKYEGALFHGKMEGEGVYAKASGDVFVSQFRAGKREGHGYILNRSGDRFEGGFVNDAKEGAGTYQHAVGGPGNGCIDVGMYCGNRQVGDGVMWTARLTHAVRMRDGEVARDSATNQPELLSLADAAAFARARGVTPPNERTESIEEAARKRMAATREKISAVAIQRRVRGAVARRSTKKLLQARASKAAAK